MPEVDRELDRLEDSLKALARAWNQAEGRHGRIAENRAEVAETQEQLKKDREALRQEQWRTRKESSTLQHARDEAERLSKVIESTRSERHKTQNNLRHILSNIKVLQKELRR